MGCGSGLSAAVLQRQHGVGSWLGTDITPEMARMAAAQPGGGGAIVLSDFGQGLPLRGACLDGAISISAVQASFRPASAAGLEGTGHRDADVLWATVVGSEQLVGLPCLALAWIDSACLVYPPRCSGSVAAPARTRPAASSASLPACTAACAPAPGQRFRCTRKVRAGRGSVQCSAVQSVAWFAG